MVKDVAIVYPVAGLSSRFNGKIKQFVEIGLNGESLIEYSLNQALKSGFCKIIFIVGKKTEKLFKEKFGDKYRGVPVYYVFQEFNEKKRDKPWGTADALCCIRNIIDCPFVFCNGDDIYGENSFKILFQHLQENDFEAAIGYKLRQVIPESGCVNRGIFYCDENNWIKKIKETFNIEKKNIHEKNLTENSLCNMNIFGFHPIFVDILYKELLDFKLKNLKDKKIEALITEEISKLIEKNKIKLKLYFSPDKWLGVTNPGDEEIVRRCLKES